MIDQKIIEKLDRLDDATILRRLPDSERSFFEYGFQRGYNRAINELLKDLWYPASEKPLLRNGKCLVVYNGGKIDIFKISYVYEMLSNYGKDGMGWKYWCYVSDLFPKEGGEQ